MANTIANMLRRRGQATLLRVDHSDVYFENDRLELNLTYDKSALSKEKYRQQINRQAEILELRKTILLQQRSASTTNLLKVMERKPSSQHLTTSLSTPLQATSAPVKRPVSVFSDSESSTTSTDLDLKSKSKSLSVRMLKANSAFSDDSGTISSRQSDDLASEIVYTAPSIKPHPVVPKSAPVSRKARINAMLKSLRLDKIPPHWYTTVIPAKDVHVNYNINSTATARESSKRPRTTQGSSLRRSISRGTTRSAKSKQPVSSPQTVEVSTTTKTRRQLQELANENVLSENCANLWLKPYLERNKIERFDIDQKVKEFVEDLKKRQNKKKFSDVI